MTVVIDDEYELAPHMVDRASYLTRALVGEFARVRLWHSWPKVDSGKPRSWLEAMASVADNPPSFDKQYARAFLLSMRGGVLDRFGQ